MVLASSQTASDVSVPYLVTLDEYERIKTLCMAAASSQLLNSDAPDMPTRVADAICMVVATIELGLQPMVGLRHMYSVGGKVGCTMYMLLNIAFRAGVQFQLPEVSSITDVATISIRRPEMEKWSVHSYSVDMAKAAGLVLKPNWLTMPTRLLLWRALGLGMRMDIPDLIGGMYPLEELLPDYRYDESGYPVEPIVLVKPPATKPAAPTSPNGHNGQMRQPPPTAPAQWPSVAEAEKLVSYIAHHLQIEKSEVLRLAGIAKADDITAETGWGKYKTALAAKDAIKAIWETQQKNMAPASPKSSPFGGADANGWKQEDFDTIDAFVEANFFDPEANLPMSSDDMLKRLGLSGWLDIAEGYKGAVERIKTYAETHCIPLIVHRAQSMKGKSPYIALNNAILSVRLYGQSQLSEKGKRWEEYLSTLVDHKEHTFAADQMPDLVITQWERKEKGEAAYNTVLKDGLQELIDTW